MTDRSSIELAQARHREESEREQMEQEDERTLQDVFADELHNQWRIQSDKMLQLDAAADAEESEAPGNFHAHTGPTGSPGDNDSEADSFASGRGWVDAISS